MIKYVAFLRGINVGGHKIIKMENLKKIFESLNFKNVKTFIQSGNVIFETSEKKLDPLTKKIMEKLHKSLGYEVIIFLRSISEVENIVKHNPFNKKKLDENFQTYVTFLSEKLNNEQKKLLTSFDNDNETFKTKNREIFSLINKGNKKAKLLFSNNFLENKLKVLGTTRNLTSIKKLLKFSYD